MKKWLLGWLSATFCSLLIAGVTVGTFTAVTFSDPAQAVAAEDDDEGDSDDSGSKKPSTNLLVWLYGAAGPLYSFVFLGLSFLLVALTFKYGLAFRRDQNIPAGFAEQFEGLLNEKRFQEVYEMTKNDDSFLGQVLAAGLAKIASGRDQAFKAMEEMTTNISMGTEHGVSIVGLIAGTSTMIGLLGTIDGMIRSFSVIAASTATPKPADLAGGISVAMVTTMMGLVVAIPAIVIYSLLRNRYQRLVYEVGMVSEDLIGKLLASAQKK